MNQPSLSTTLALALPTLSLGLVAYIVHRFTTRISPNVPYVGEGSWKERLKVPVQYGKDPIGTLVKARKELGNVFCVDLLIFRVVFVLGAEGNREVLKSAEEDLSFWEQARWAFGPRLSATIDYPGWSKSSMKVLKLGIAKQERLDGYYKAAAPIVHEYFSKWAKEDSVPLFQSFSSLILAVNLAFWMGDDFRHKYGAEIIPMMARYELDLQKPVLRVLPFSLWVWSGPGSRVFKAQDRFDEIIIAETRERLANPEKYANRPDYFNYLLEHFGDEFQVCYGQHIMSLVFAGHTNAAMTTPWMFLHARRRPGTIERWREEVLALDNGSGNQTNLSYEQSNSQRPFLEASMRETSRLYTNTLMLRFTTKEFPVAGHTLPSNTIVACSPLATQRDESLFPDPTTWDPTRFLKDDSYASWFQRAEFIQFGIGQHACPGERIAKMVILDIVMGTWLRGYDIEVVSGLKEGVGIGGVGIEASWSEKNIGTPAVRGEDVRIRVKRRLD